MLRHGLSTYDFSRVANIAFVQAARDILREQGKSSSFSRISTITGLHRHVVSDIVNCEEPTEPDPEIEKDYRRNRLARLTRSTSSITSLSRMSAGIICFSFCSPSRGPTSISATRRGRDVDIVEAPSVAARAVDDAV